jgi:hypothetical protein
MWQKPFGYSEYILIGGGLTLTGVMLQITVGAIDWSLVAFPANVVLLCLLTAVIVGMHLLRKRVYMFRCLSEVRMAVVALSFVAALTFVMGMIRQDGASMGMSPHLSLGFRNMLHAWWLVLPYLWLTVCLGLTAMRRTFPFHFRNIPFLLNHWGLFLVLVCGTLGSADIQQFTLQAYPHKPEWRAVDDKGAMHELPLAIELQQFSMEEYPARMMVIDNGSGKAQPEKGPQTMTTDEKKGKILDWQITINRYMDYSAPVETKAYTVCKICGVGVEWCHGVGSRHGHSIVRTHQQSAAGGSVVAAISSRSMCWHWTSTYIARDGRTGTEEVRLGREGLHQRRATCIPGFHHGEQTSQCDGLEDLSVGL